ncbi:MAG: ABC transporter permease subunit [Verrucomicrobiales bacterium]|nr:ABC transporter permease subunit [Verrucomicrobiales bacterium]
MGIFFRQLWGELVRLFARKRTYIGFIAFLGLEATLVWFFHRPKPQEWIQKMGENAGGELLGDVFSALTLGFLVLGFSVFLLGGIYIALVSGDIVAKEAEDGTLRMVLSRPASRLRVLVLKWASCWIYTVALVAFIGATSLGVGVILRGTGGMFLVIAPEAKFLQLYDWDEGLVKYAMAVGMLSLSMGVMASVGFLFSCFKVKPAAASILALTVLFADFVMGKMPPLEAYRPYFLTTKMDAWVEILRDPVPVATLVMEYGILAGVCVTCFVVGAVVFQLRDFKT